MIDWLGRQDDRRPIVHTGPVAKFSPDAGEGRKADPSRP